MKPAVTHFYPLLIVIEFASCKTQNNTELVKSGKKIFILLKVLVSNLIFLFIVYEPMLRVILFFHFADLGNKSNVLEIKSSPSQEENEIDQCRVADCSNEGVIEKCPITCRWYDQTPSDGIKCTFDNDLDSICRSRYFETPLTPIVYCKFRKIFNCNRI